MTRFRLRSKLALALGVAALAPVILVALLALRVVFASLERDLRRDADRQRDIALNVVLRATESVGTGLFRAVDVAPRRPDGTVDAVALRRATVAGDLPRGTLHVLAVPGQPPMAWAVGGAAPLASGGAPLAESDPMVTRAKGLERTIDLAILDDVMVARAATPLVDASLQFRGVAVLEVPLDGTFADRIAATLGDNIVLATRRRAWSSFRDEHGGPVVVPPPPAERLVSSGAAMTEFERAGASDAAHWQISWIALRDQQREPVGWLGVAVSRRGLHEAQRQAIRAIIIVGATSVVLAGLLALALARMLGRPLARLHTGAIAVARGDLEHRFELAPGDEFADLAAAFSHMTAALRTNEARLEARVRELVELHDASRAIASEIELDAVSQKAVDSVARAFAAERASVWLRRSFGAGTGAGGPAEDAVVAWAGRVRGGRDRQAALDAVQGEAPAATRALAGGGARTSHDGRPQLVAALELGGQAFGAIVVVRPAGDAGFSPADASLLATFAGQAAAAIDNARLYAQVRGASEDLERKVLLRTAELTAINAELGRALAELRDAQAQLVLSERMAGLGTLVASVAHEINSPSAAIRGSVDAMGDVIRRIGEQYATLANADVAPERHQELLRTIDALAARLASQPLATGPAVRQRARVLRQLADDLGAPALAALAAQLADLGLADADVRDLAAKLEDLPAALAPVVLDALADHVYLQRMVETIRAAIGRVQRLVGALKSYSHVDRDPARVPTDLHAGIETTLTLFGHALRDIDVRRQFTALPPVPVFVDELNQVWTNLIQNALQALGGSGTVTIATELDAGRDAGPGFAVVRVIDDGPGIPAEVLPRIFEPFFTTKAAGEGSGLGLGIVRRIVERHGGTVACTSRPGHTEFVVRLPLRVAEAEA